MSVGIQLGATGPQMGVTVNAARATCQGAGNDIMFTNTQVAVTNMNIDSVGDTTLKG